MDNLSMILGKPLVVDGITVRHPKISDIIELGESEYMSIINIFTLKPSDMMVELYDIGINFNTITPFDLFMLLSGETITIKEDGCLSVNEKSEVSKKIGWLTGIYDFYVSYEEKMQLKSDSTGLYIDEEIYRKIRRFLLDIHFRDDKLKYNPANDTTLKFLVEEERRKNNRRKNKQDKSVFASIISSLVWVGGKSFDEISSMYIYQVFDGINRIERDKQYSNICYGFYSGNIASKDFKNMIDDINWTN